MFLSALLRGSRIPGKQWIGKHRRPRRVTWGMKRGLLRRLEIEAENEYWLSMPYMSWEQEFNHSASRRRENFEAIKLAQASRFPSHRCFEDHLGHLSVSKKWC